MSGILHENPYITEFELSTLSNVAFLNVNHYLENFEDCVVGPNLKKLVLKEALIYTEKTKFLEDGTNCLEHLCVNKTVLSQKNFRLSENLRVLKLQPVNFATDAFEINLD